MVAGRRNFCFHLDLARSRAESMPPGPPALSWPHGDECNTPGTDAATANARDRNLMRDFFTVVAHIGDGR